MAVASLLNTGITIPILKERKIKNTVKKEKLKIISKGFDITQFKVFKILVGILKGPTDLLLLRLLISFSISGA